MKKIFIFTLMVIGYMSFTLSTNPQISSSTSTSEFNSQATSTVNSGAVNSALLATQVSNASFQVGTYYNTSYVDPNNGQLYAAGRNNYGQMGLGYDEDGNGITANQQSFTPLYKSGDASQLFINPIDWNIGDFMSAIIDADGKLWTAGMQVRGGLGNGYITSDSTDRQYTFEMVEINGTYDYTAVKLDVGSVDASNIVMLDDGTIWCAGQCYNFGLSYNGGVTSAGVEGGIYYTTFTQIDNTSEDEAIRYEMPFDAKDIVDFKTGASHTMYLLEDGSLYRCNTNGYTLVGSDVVSFDVAHTYSYYADSLGDVYYAAGTTAAFEKILSAGEYEGSIDSIYSSSGGSTTNSKWAYLTTTGDVYFASEAGGTDLVKIAEDVIYFDLGGYSNYILGAITKSGEFKLWGNDNSGALGNGATEGSNVVDTDNALDAFENEVATPSTPTTDGNNVTPPSVDAETGELQKDEDGNIVAIIPTLSTPAPAKIF